MKPTVENVIDVRRKAAALEIRVDLRWRRIAWDRFTLANVEIHRRGV